MKSYSHKFVHARINDDLIINEISKVFIEDTLNSTIPNTNIYKDAVGKFKPREIVKCTENDLWIMCADAIIKIESAMTPTQYELTPLDMAKKLGVKKGDYLKNQF